MRKIITIENFFCLVIFSMPLYLVRVSIFGWPTNVFELLAVLAIVFWLTKNRNYLQDKLQNIPKLLFAGIFLMLAGVLLSILFNADYRAGFGIFKSWFLIPIIFAFALYTITNLTETVEKIFLSIYFSTALVAIISVVYKLLGVVTYDNRLTDFYLSPNYLAMYLAPGIFFGFYFLQKSFLEKKYQWQTYLHIVLLTLILASLYWTYSYAAWLAMFVSLMITAMLSVSKSKRALIGGLFVAIIAIIFIFQIPAQKFSNLINSNNHSSLDSRIAIWKSSVLMIRNQPFFGIGPGNFQTKYLGNQKYFPPYPQWAVPEPHNIFLAFWTHAGILGLIGFLLILLFVLRTLWKLLRDKKSTALAAPLLGFFIYTILHGLVDTPYWKNDLSFLFWICVFLVVELKFLNTPTSLSCRWRRRLHHGSTWPESKIIHAKKRARLQVISMKL